MAIPLPFNNSPSVRQDRAKPWVTPPMKRTEPYLKIDPRPWQRVDRNTPGMINRVLEDRWDDQSLINSNISAPSELTNRSNTTKLPEALRRQYYMEYALAAAGMILIWTACRA